MAAAQKNRMTDPAALAVSPLEAQRFVAISAKGSTLKATGLELNPIGQFPLSSGLFMYFYFIMVIDFGLVRQNCLQQAFSAV